MTNYMDISETKPDLRKIWLAAQFENAAFEIKKEEYSFEKNTTYSCSYGKF